jgi:hypothetical protein
VLIYKYELLHLCAEEKHKIPFSREREREFKYKGKYINPYIMYIIKEDPHYDIIPVRDSTGNINRIARLAVISTSEKPEDINLFNTIEYLAELKEAIYFNNLKELSKRIVEKGSQIRGSKGYNMLLAAKLLLTINDEPN